MAKKVVTFVKLQIQAGQANPSPPVGPALGQHGVNIIEFCKAFNARTQGQEGMVIPVVITIYSDRSFTFVTKTPPASTSFKEGSQDCERFGRAQSEQSRESDKRSGSRDCPDKVERSERGGLGRGHPDGRGHSSKYGIGGRVKGVWHRGERNT